ncbi:capsular polysaccharide biosynthesis protein [Treponema primitia ZAS-2]|uniref:Capsular polysaccharide biosynthesis protein n=1 Tax=Treponema primitia (strain ATCC BAA-887 / DSM 12427 / ZAS-2) TaxID=545694 RepID=F5YN38_TREPZ|nr:glycosyltransferase [Treponema primitia]AEF84577.1 capsular polysaccharide biosynthesis protein [Treponema primitia ZAS-2]
MIRILNIIGSLNCGGAETTIMNYYRNIDRTRIQFDFLITTYNDYYETEAIALGSHIFRRPMRTQNVIMNTFILMSILLKHKEYKMIHIHHSTPIVFFDVFIAWLCGVPIRIVHSRNARENISLLERLLRPLLRMFTTKMLACSSEAGSALFGKKAIINNEVILFPNARDISRLIYNKKSRDVIRKTLNIDSNFVILHIGRLSNIKNQSFLLDVFAGFLKLCPRAVLLIAGEGNMLELLVKKISELRIDNAVQLLGFRDDIPDLMQAGDIFVLPSLWEGLPGVVIEAQAMGLPCLLSNTITRETKITDLVEFLPIDQISIWVTRLLVYQDGFIRHDMYDQVTKSGYNIIQAVKKLQQFYLEIFDKCQK